MTANLTTTETLSDDEFEGFTCTGCGCDVSPEDEVLYDEWWAARRQLMN